MGCEYEIKLKYLYLEKLASGETQTPIAIDKQVVPWRLEISLLYGIFELEDKKTVINLKQFDDRPVTIKNR